MTKGTDSSESVLRRTVLKAGTVVAGALAVSGSTTAHSDQPEATVGVDSHPDLGEILVGPDGLTLYMFDADEQDAGESACHDECLEAWPPLVADEPIAGDGVTAELTTFEREDGEMQVAADGWPLYWFADDGAPGDVTGQGVNDVWWVLDPDGTPIRDSPDEDEPVDELTDQLLTVREATRPYWCVDRARADGYDGDVSPYDPGMGFHFVNPELVADTEDESMDLTAPPILVYVPKAGYEPDPGDEHDPERDDELVLAAVEFAHTGTEGADADLFADEAAEPAPAVSEADGWAFVEGPDITALHVWVPHWNPEGVFNPTNPAVD